MQQELVTLPEHPSSPSVLFSVVRVAQSLVFCIVFVFVHLIICPFVFFFLLTMVLPFVDVHARRVIGLLWVFAFDYAIALL